MPEAVANPTPTSSSGSPGFRGDLIPTSSMGSPFSFTRVAEDTALRLRTLRALVPHVQTDSAPTSSLVLFGLVLLIQLMVSDIPPGTTSVPEIHATIPPVPEPTSSPVPVGGVILKHFRPGATSIPGLSVVIATNAMPTAE